MKAIKTPLSIHPIVGGNQQVRDADGTVLGHLYAGPAEQIVAAVNNTKLLESALEIAMCVAGQAGADRKTDGTPCVWFRDCLQMLPDDAKARVRAACQRTQAAPPAPIPTLPNGDPGQIEAPEQFETP